MAIENTFNPNYAIHPGELLAELIDVSRFEQMELALRLDITPKHLSNIVNEKASITAKTAVALECVFPDRPARYWLMLQNEYDEFEARKSSEDRFAQEESEGWLARFDMAALEKAGYVSKLDANAGVWERTWSLLKFFGCSSVAAWKRVYGDLSATTVRHWDERGSLSLAWMRKGQVDAASCLYDLPRFERRAFKRSLYRSKSSTRSLSSNAMDALKSQCAEAGVLLLVEEPLPDMRARSASFWMRNTPVVQLRADARTDEEPLLDFAREAVEVLRGKAYLMSLNDDDWRFEGEYEDGLSWLVSWERSLAFASDRDFSPDAIRKFAHEEGVHPGVVVGLLQRLGLVPDDGPLNRLKSHVEYSIEPF